MRKTFEDMKIPLDVLHIPDIPTTTSKVSLAGMNITVRQSRQSGVARATCPD